MNLTCNIDQRGAKVRRVWGVLCIVIGWVLAAAALVVGPGWLWIPAGLAWGAGVFALYEARKKWCVVRALGIKTPV